MLVSVPLQVPHEGAETSIIQTIPPKERHAYAATVCVHLRNSAIVLQASRNPSWQPPWHSPEPAGELLAELEGSSTASFQR